MKYAVEVNFLGAVYKHTIEARDEAHVLTKISSMYHKPENVSIKCLEQGFEVVDTDIPHFLRIKQ